MSINLIINNKMASGTEITFHLNKKVNFHISLAFVLL